ncbi:MAG: hypothetical protein QG570_407 [Patescibacteria group bacterium]|nr:hypothetical protein [Patescibacteria group bacterium]
MFNSPLTGMIMYSVAAILMLAVLILAVIIGYNIKDRLEQVMIKREEELSYGFNS